MRYVVGTFDAPVPASAGVRALELSGVARADIGVIDARDIGPIPDLLTAADGALLTKLAASGRTAVVARVPTALAGAAAAALRSVGASGVTESANPGG